MKTALFYKENCKDVRLSYKCQKEDDSNTANHTQYPQKMFSCNLISTKSHKQAKFQLRK